MQPWQVVSDPSRYSSPRARRSDDAPYLQPPERCSQRRPSRARSSPSNVNQGRSGKSADRARLAAVLSGVAGAGAGLICGFFRLALKEAERLRISLPAQWQDEALL